MDMTRYRAVFLEEASDHLAELSRGLLELEKDAAEGASIDLAFRMAHSIKGMASSLYYDSISEAAHELESQMQAIRARGRAEPAEMAPLFAGLEELEFLIAHVRSHGEAPPRRSAAKKKTLKPC